jgi:hypothetical protein
VVDSCKHDNESKVWEISGTVEWQSASQEYAMTLLLLLKLLLLLLNYYYCALF